MQKRKVRAFLHRFISLVEIRRRFFASPAPTVEFATLPKFLTLRQTAEILQVHRNTLRSWDASGKLRAVRFGSRQDRRYGRDEVAAMWSLSFGRTFQQQLRASVIPWRRVGLSLGAGVIIIFLGASWSQLTAFADEPKSTAVTAQPASCSGWTNALKATQVTLAVGSAFEKYSPANSAQFASRDLGVSSQGGRVSTSFDQIVSQLDCLNFSVSGKTSGTLQDAAVRVSLGTRAAVNSTDSVTASWSLDGEHWEKLATEPLRREEQTAMVAALPDLRDVHELEQLRIRLEPELALDGASTIYIDGVQFTGRITSATPTVKNNSDREKELDRLTAFSQTSYESTDQPTITVPKKQTKTLFFFAKKTEEWKLQSVALVDAKGNVQPADYRTTDEVRGANTNARLRLRMSAQHPGKYLLRVTMTSPSGTKEIVEEPFLWGVLAVNLRRASPAVGERQEVGIAVLDDAGRTLCDARVRATVISPKGKRTTLDTKNKSIVMNSGCIDKGVTNKADYSFSLPLDQAGVYRLSVEAQTLAGERKVEENFVVAESAPFEVERVDYPTRIYPVAKYPVRIAITPAKDYLGLVTEEVPTNFVITDVFPAGTVRKTGTTVSKQFIDWLVEWKAGQTYFLTYTFDAPDVSPALFLAGPLTVGGSFIAAADFQEARQWQIASDTLVKKTKDEIAFTALKDNAADWVSNQPAAIDISKQLFSSDEQVAVKLWSAGFTIGGGSGPAKITTYEVVPPNGGNAGFDQADDLLKKDGRERMVLYLVPNDRFQPGAFTVNLTIEQQGVKRTESRTFQWGTLEVRAPSGTVYTKDRLDLSLASFDHNGVVDCATPLEVEVKQFGLEPKIYTTNEATVTAPATCSEAVPGRTGTYELPLIPEKAGRYRITIRRLGTHPAALERVVTVAARQKTPTSVEKDITAAVKVGKKLYRADEKPMVQVETTTAGVLGRKTNRQITAVKLVEPNTKSDIIDPTTTTVAQASDVVTTLAIDPLTLHKPGKYKVVTTVVQDGYAEEVTQDFTWGVLDVNVRRSYSHTNTEIEVAMSVLDDIGKTQCDADVQLDITDPQGQIQHFKTDDQSIKIDPDCVDRGITIKPDYGALYTTGGPGQYTMKVTATIANGTRSITDTFQVDDTQPFDVERTTFPTRIYPLPTYPVSFTITAKQDYAGPVVESVTSMFTITDITDGGTEFTPDPATKLITWNVDWKAGETHTLGYTIGFPNRAPDFYVLGPLTIGSFKEARKWQIASDASNCTLSYSAAYNWTTTTSWATCNGSYPGATVSGDTASITNITTGATLTFNTNITTNALAGLTINANAVASTLALGANTMTVNGTVTVTQPSAAVTTTLSMTSGTLNIQNSNNLALAGTTTTASTIATVTVTTGLLDVGGSITYGATASMPAANKVVSVTNTGTIRIRSAETLNCGTLRNLTTAGTIQFDALFTIGSATCNSANAVFSTIASSTVKINAGLTTTASSSPTVTFNATSLAQFTTSGTITPSAGTLTLGKVQIDSGAVVTLAGGVTVAATGTTAFVNNNTTGSWTGAQTTTFSGAAPTVVGNTTFSTLTTTGAASTFTVGANTTVTVTNNYSDAQGAGATKLDLNTNANAVMTVGGTFTIQNSSGASTNTYNVGAGTLTVTGEIIWTGNSATVSRIGSLVTTTGTVNANGGIDTTGTPATCNGCNNINISGGAGKFYLKGHVQANNVNEGAAGWVFTNSTCTNGGGEFIYQDTASQVIYFPSSGGYCNLTSLNTNAAGALVNTNISTSNLKGALTVGKSDGSVAAIMDLNNKTITGNSGQTMFIYNTATVIQVGASGGSFPSGFTTFTFTSNSNYNFKTSGTTTAIGAVTYGNVNFVPTATVTFTLPTGTVTVGGTLTIGDGTNTTILRDQINNSVLTVTGNFTMTNNSQFTGHASNPVSVGGNLSVAATNTTFTHNNGTFTFTSTATGKTINTDSESFYNVIFNGSGGSWKPVTNSMTIANDLTMTAGTFEGNGALNVTVNGQAVGTAGIIDMTANSGTGTFENRVAVSESFGPTTTSTNWTFYNLKFTTSAADPVITTQACTTCGVTVTTVMTIGSVSDANRLSFVAGGTTWTLSGNGTPLVVTATSGATNRSFFDAGTSTVVYTHATSATVTPVTYYNLKTNGAGTYTVTAPSTDDFNRAAPLGSNWTVRDGAPTIGCSSTCYAGTSAGADNLAYYGAFGTYNPDQFSEITITNLPAGEELAPCVRINATGAISYYCLERNGSNYEISEKSAGSIAGLGSTFAPPSVGDVVRLEVSGNTTAVLRVYYNGVMITEVSDASPRGEGNPGINDYAASPAGTADNWKGGSMLVANADILATLGTLALGDNAVIVKGGDITVGGTLSQNGSDGIAGGSVVVETTGSIGGGTTSFGNLTIGGAGTTQTTTAGGNFTVNGVLRLAPSTGANTFSGSTRTIAIGGTSATPFVVGTNGIFTASTSTISFTTINASTNVSLPAVDFSSLSLSPSSAETYNTTASGTASGTLTVGANGTLNIVTTHVLSATGAEVANSGTISGAGTLRFTDTSGGPGTSGTLSSLVRFDATTANIANTTFDARTYGGAVEFYSNAAAGKSISSASSGTYVLSSTVTVTTAGAGATTLDLNTTDPTTFTVTGTLTNGANSIIQATSSGTFNVNGNYVNSGTFTHNSGTVTAAGSAQQAWSGTLSGSTGKFNNLTITNAFGDGSSTFSLTFAGDAETAATFTATTASTKLRFNATSTYTFQNLTLNGQASGTRVYLRSSTGASAWLLNVAGTATVSYTNVMDSNATGSASPINATNGTNFDATGNTNWNFTVFTVSGGCFTDESEGTPCTDDGANEIKMAINGVVDSGVDTVVDGSWTFAPASTPSSGATLVFFINGEATAGEEATTVVKYDGSGDVTLVKMYQSQLVLGTDSGSANSDQTIAVADLDTTTNGYENSDDEDVIYDVTAGSDLTVDAEADKTEQLYIMNGETYRPASGGGSDTTTQNFEIDATAIVTADSNAFVVAGDWTNAGTFTAGTSTVTFNGAAAQTVVTNANAFNLLTLNNTGSTGSGDDVTISATLDVNSTLTITDGDLQLATNDPNVTTAGDLSIATNGLVTKADNGSSTWTFDGSGTSTWTDSAGTTQDLGLVVIDGSTKTVNMGSSVRVTKLTVTDTFGLASSGYTLTLTGSGQTSAQPLIVTGTLNEGSNSTVDYIGTTISDVERETYNNLSVRPGGTVAFHAEGGGTLTIDGNLIVGDSSNAGNFDLNSSDPVTDIAGNVTINPSATLVASGSAALTIGGAWTNNGTFTSNGSTITFDDTTGSNNVSGSIGSVLINASGASYTNPALFDVNGSFRLQAGSFTQGASSNITVSGDFRLDNGTTWTKASGAGTLTFDGDLSFTDNNTSKQDMGAVIIGTSPDTTTLATDFAASSLTINAGDVFNTKGYEVDLSGTFTCVSTCTLDMTDTASGNEGDGTIFTFGGNWDVQSSSATITPHTGSRVEPDGTADQTITTQGKAFQDFRLNNTGSSGSDDIIFSGAVDVNGTLTINDGDFDVNTNDPNITTAGAVTINTNGSIDRGSGSWTFDGTTAAIFTDASSGGPQNMGTVIFNKTSGVGANDKVTLASSMTVNTADIQTGDTLDLASSGYTFRLLNAGATATVLTVTGTLTPGSNSTVQFSATNSGGAVTVPATTYNNLKLSGNETYNLGNNLTSSNALTGGVTIDAGGATLDAVSGSNYSIELAGSWTNNGTYTTRSNTVTFTGNSTTIGGSSNSTFNNLTINGTNITVTVNTDATVSATLIVGGDAAANTDVLSIATSKYVTTNSTVTITDATDTISGAGTLTVKSSSLGTAGTLSANVRFDATGGNITAPARAYGANIEIYENSSSARTVTLGTGTHTISGSVMINGNHDVVAGTTTLDGATSSPTVTISGSVNGTDFGGSESVTITMGSGTWSVGGDFNMTYITTLTAGTSTLLMNGTGTLTSNGKTLNNLQINSSGTVTLAGATHTVNGNLLLGGSGTPTVTSSTILMNGTTKTIDGGGKTLNNLTLDGASTYTLQNTDLTVSGTLNATSGDTLSISSGRTVSATGTTTLSGTISGSGTLLFTSTSSGPAATGTLSSVVRFDATSADIPSTTVDARSYRGRVEFYSNSGSARLVTFPTGTFTCNGASSHYYLIADGAGNLTVNTSSNNPATLSICGNLDFTGTGGGTEILSAGTGSINMGGSVTFTDGTFTSNGGLNMNSGSVTQTLTTAGNSLKNLTSNSVDLVFANETITITGNLDLSASGNVTPGTSTIVMTGTSNTMNNGGWILYNLTIDPASTGTITDLGGTVVENTLTVATGDTLSLDGASIVNSSLATSTLVLNGTISGAGQYWYQGSATFPTTGTLSSETWFVADPTATITLAGRTFGGTVVFDHAQATGRTLRLGSGASETFTFSGNLEIRSDGVGSSTIDAATNNPTVNVTGNVVKQLFDPGTGVLNITSGTGTWTVGGSVTLTGITYTATSGNTLAMNGTSKTLTSAGNSLHHLTVSGGSVSASGATTLNGNMLISGGSFTAPSAAFSIAGNWTNSGGTFVEGTNTVTLNGTSSVTLNSGCSTVTSCTNENFYDLTINKTAGAGANDNVTLTSTGLRVTHTLTVTAGELVQGALNVQVDTGGNVSVGASGIWTNISTGDLFLGGGFANAGSVTFSSSNAAQCTDVADDIVIDSTVDNTIRTWSGAGTYTMRNINVDDMSDGAITITIYTSTKSGDTDWTAGACGITVSGVLSEDGSTPVDCSGDNTPIVLKVNGAGSYSTTCTDPDGNYSISGVTIGVAGDVITVFTDLSVTGSWPATTVTLAANTSSDITDMDLWGYNTILRHENAGPITNLNLGQYDDDNDVDVGFTSNSGAVTFGTGRSVTILDGKTYLPGGTITTTVGMSLYPSANMTVDTAGSSIGNVGVTSGATLTINATSSYLGGIFTFDTGVIQTTSGTPTVTVSSGNIGGGSGAVTFHNLTIDGTVYWGGTGTNTVNNNLVVDATGRLNQNVSVTVAGSLTTTTTGVLTYNSGTPTVVVQGASLGGGSGMVQFYNLTKSNAGTLTWTGSGSMIVKNTLAVSAGTLTMPSGTVYVEQINQTGGTITHNSGSIMLNSPANRTQTATSTLNNVSINDGLVGYWNFDETAGPTAADGSGYGHTGTHTNSPTISTDVPTLAFANSRSLSFNGSSQYVQIGTPEWLNNQWTDKFSVSLWMKPATLSGDHVVIGQSHNAPHVSPFYNWNIFQSNSLICFRIDNTSTCSSGGAITTAWQHVAARYDGANMYLYVNNTQVATTAKTGAIINGGTRNIRIAARDTTSLAEYYGGLIDEVRVYRRDLSTGEISSLNSGNRWGFSGTTQTLGAALTTAGAMAIKSGTLDVDNSGNYAVNVGGNWANDGGLFTKRAGTVTLNGSAQQTVSGYLTSTSQFNNLTVTNASGSDPDSSPSVIFSDDLAAAGTLTATTANTKLRFTAGKTFSPTNLTLNGQATGTRVALRSSSNGTAWNLTSTGTQSVSNTDVRDSYACGGDTIDATDGTSVDATNNSCWDINTISLTISDTTIGFGVCAPAAARYATGNTNGSASDSADAHTISVATNARGGYSLTVAGATLTSTAGTISAIGGSATASSAGSEQFGLRAIKNSGTGTVSSPFDTANWAFSAGSPQAIASYSGAHSSYSAAYGLRYLCNVSDTTEAGSYSTDLTYILTSTF